MSRVPAITFELLRGGPPHNQLISPITDYLALCGDASPHVLRLPFEHRDLTDRLGRLRYTPAGDSAHTERSAELRRLGRDVGAVLGSVPAFASELSGLRADGEGVVQLRLVLAGNELALLPWEAAHIPSGLPGSGLPLLLHPGAPVSLTREVRGASRRRFEWDRVPRVLFAAADANQFPPNTIEAHLLALRRALQPWAYREWLKNGWQADYPIEMLERASVKSIRERCMRHQFTHVHILAHGQPTLGSEERFGLRLHDSKDPAKAEIVTGEQLAQALRAGCTRDRASDPVVVTLASCESASQGSVMVPGGSVAHELHQYGIPWVIASQFPLTVTGSVLLTDDLYDHLMRGEDPRRSLHCLRSHLAARYSDRHDWASLVVYCSTPIEFDQQADRFRRRALFESRNQAYSLVDLVLLKRMGENPANAEEAAAFATLGDSFWTDILEVDRARAAVNHVCNAFETERRDLATSDADPEVIERRLATMDTNHAALLKRRAELQHYYPQPEDDWQRTLDDARDWYLKGSAFTNGTDHWAIGQYFVLDEVLRHAPGRYVANSSGDRRDAEHIQWRVACHATAMHIKSESRTRRMWARSTLADLIMVAIGREDQSFAWDPPPWTLEERPVFEPIDVLIATLEDMMADGNEATWPTFRQFWRYHKWWTREEQRWDERYTEANARWNQAARAGYEVLLRRLKSTLFVRAADARRLASDKRALRR